MTATQPPAPAEHPAAGAGPTPEQAAWIREHAWTAAMRKTYREVPLSFHRCACQSGPTHWCQIGQCDRCHRATPQRSEATVICGRGGSHPVHFTEPYRHRTDTSATGPRYETAAMVWLADRVCRWVCEHDCHTAPAKPKTVLKPVQGVLLFEVGP